MEEVVTIVTDTGRLICFCDTTTTIPAPLALYPMKNLDTIVYIYCCISIFMNILEYIYTHPIPIITLEPHDVDVEVGVTLSTVSFWFPQNT